MPRPSAPAVSCSCLAHQSHVAREHQRIDAELADAAADELCVLAAIVEHANGCVLRRALPLPVGRWRRHLSVAGPKRRCGDAVSGAFLSRLFAVQQPLLVDPLKRPPRAAARTPRRRASIPSASMAVTAVC